MDIRYLASFLVVSLLSPPYAGLGTDVPRAERIMFLKSVIGNELKKIKPVREKDILVDDNYDYVEKSRYHITPIMDSDERKRDERYRLREFITRSTTTESGWDVDINRARFQLEGKVHKAKAGRVGEGAYNEERHKSRVTKNYAEMPADIFYRRFPSLEIKNKPLQWIQCQDVITPYLNGFKTGMVPTKRYSLKDRQVYRFLQLITMNVKNFGADDIYAVLYQISNYQIRLFQWDLLAVKALFNALYPAPKHSFSMIKKGVQSLFKAWHLDFTENVTQLARQAKIFRPICLEPNKQDSTLSSRSSPYTTASKTTSNKCDDTEEEEEARRHNKNARTEPTTIALNSTAPGRRQNTNAPTSNVTHKNPVPRKRRDIESTVSNATYLKHSLKSEEKSNVTEIGGNKGQT